MIERIEAAITSCHTAIDHLVPLHNREIYHLIGPSIDTLDNTILLLSDIKEDMIRHEAQKGSQEAYYNYEEQDE